MNTPLPDKKIEALLGRLTPALPDPALMARLSASPVSRELTAHLPIQSETGLTIDHVAKDSPAEKAGLQPNDVLAKLDDQILIHPVQLAVLVAGKKEGDSVKLTYVRKGQIAETSAGLVRKETTSAEARSAQIDVADADIVIDGEPGRPLRTFVRRIKGPDGGEAGSVTIGGGAVQVAPGAAASGSATFSAPPAQDNADIRKELQELRATLDALQQKLK